jgi:plastocyanin domain-containing protein
MSRRALVSRPSSPSSSRSPLTRSAALALSVSLAALALLGACNKGESKPEAKPADVTKVAAAEIVGRRIDVLASDKGFTPNDVRIKKGEQATLVFTRTTDDTCADAVVIKDLKIEKKLPLKTEVAVTIPAGEAKTYEFACGMGMFKSKIVVE